VTSRPWPKKETDVNLKRSLVWSKITLSNLYVCRETDELQQYGGYSSRCFGAICCRPLRLRIRTLLPNSLRSYLRNVLEELCKPVNDYNCFMCPHRFSQRCEIINPMFTVCKPLIRGQEDTFHGSRFRVTSS